MIWDITRTVNPNYNKIRPGVTTSAGGAMCGGVEATFTLLDQDSTPVVAKVEPKFRPDLIFEPKHAFTKINEDVYALSWFVESKHELLYGTDTNVKVCDTREFQSLHKGQFDDSNKSAVLSIKFDPFDSRRFGALTDEAIKVFDLRNMRRPLVLINNSQINQGNNQGERYFGGFEWSLLRSNLLVSFMKRSVSLI